MLRTDFRFPLHGWPLRLVAFLLGESFLGFLAIVAVGFTLFPMLFDVPPRVHAAIDTLQWLIIAWFAVEYLVALALAPSKRAFLLDPWRILDLATILVPVASLLPNVSDALLSSPVLRLVRLARLVTLGVRVSGVAVRHRAVRATEEATSAPVQAWAMPEQGGAERRAVEWSEVVRWTEAPARGWRHVAHAGPEQLAELGRAAGLPAGFLENHLFNTNYPHVGSARGWTAVFVWVPEGLAGGAMPRHGVLLLLSAQGGVLSITRTGSREVEATLAEAAAVEACAAKEEPLGSRVLRGLLRAVIRRNERLVGGLEQQLRGLEDVPIRESSPMFFERTFRVKKELSVAQADLWRLKGVVADGAAGRALAVSEDAAEDLRRLTSEAEYLYETVINVRDEVLSVLELHLNVVSFDMNRVMRVLAVVSVLGLIPAVIGGLFGMNLADNPWPFTLPQVAFAVCFGMVLCLYFFFVKGWLR